MLLFSEAKIATTGPLKQSENIINFDFKIGLGYTLSPTENPLILNANY